MSRGGSGIRKTKKISYGNTITGAALTSYLASNLDRMNFPKIGSGKGTSPTKDMPSSASSKTDDEEQASRDGSQHSDGKVRTEIHQRRYRKREPSEQHSHATSLIHQIYEKKHQQLLQQQFQEYATPGMKLIRMANYN